MKDYSFLLNRPEHTFDEDEIDSALVGRRVLVTGAGGTIGSEITRRLMRAPTSFVGIVGHSELPIFNLRSTLPASKLQSAILDVGHEHVMKGLLERWRPDIIFHAAAHKHVGLMEGQPEAAFANNTLATINLARVALQSESVRRFVFISTDKAANPTTVMGASKRLAEVALCTHYHPFSTICRFGNVLGSSGSLVEIVEKRFAAGQPAIVNDERMKRFFITVKEAVGLVMTAGLLERGPGYSIDMGEQIPIVDIIKKLMSPDDRFQYGRPGSGEKLEEEIIGAGELLEPTSNPAVLGITMNPRPEIDEVLARVKQNPARIVQEAQKL